MDAHPPKQTGIDDETGEPLILRDDDREEIIRKRLEVYHHQTEPLVAYYQAEARNNPSLQFCCIKGQGNEDVIYQRIISAIEGEK